jgi:molecular chaperone DnaK (HSP70)
MAGEGMGEWDVLSQPSTRPVIGIDLGTTNSALAYTAGDAVELFQIPQLVHENEVREEPLLPSFLFLEDSGPIAGVLAQRKGLDNAGRLVSSAKSWLCYAQVDRNAPILPDAAPEGVKRISPVEASRYYLQHLKDAWDTKHPSEPFAEHQILVTVPASFDAVARDLTARAAAEAGYRDVILLEEPQAAFYAWIARNPDWREQVKVGDLILVVDIGGGTTDFTLIAVREQAGEIALERIGVGDHILLGGDNMDAALAHTLAAEMRERKLPKLDRAQFQSLVQHARSAKERLLEEGSKETSVPITILGRGSGVVGGSMKTKLERKTVDELLLDGFLPVVPKNAEPDMQAAALSEFGLPYAADAAITKHVAHFLHHQSAAPTHVLFNGGVLRAAPIRKRLLEVLNGWLAKPVVAMASDDLMHAVARGAAYYGLARQGKGVRVRGGVPRTYYIGVETPMPAVPGMRPPVKALSVAPFGMEEGSSHEIAREFRLRVGDRARFRVFASSERKEDAAGALLDELTPDMLELPNVETELAGERGETVTVKLESSVTETGVLELYFVAADRRRWKLEFNVRKG